MQGITIVTPSLNQAPYLEQCIDSILSRNHPNLEYIIMDGGSTDGSIEIIRKYEKHLSHWESRPDGGQYQALNAGFRLSRNPIMGWLNADDMLHKGGLTVIDEVFSRLPEVEFLTAKRIGFDGEGELASFGFLAQTWCHDMLMRKDLVCDHSLFVMQEATYWRRSLWDRAGSGLDASFSLAADFELWLRMSRHAALHTVNALTGGFRCYSSEQRCNLHRDQYVAQCCEVIDRELQLGIASATHMGTPPALIQYPIVEPPAPTAPGVMIRKERPKISIITPSYNQAEYLEECIDSVLSQNYPNLEYIVMDGGSTDGSPEIIKKHQRHLNYWQSRPDGGQYRAINDGLMICTGDIMAWLNSDDKYHPGALWLVADAFEAFDEVEWITGSPTLWDKNGDVSGFSGAPPLWSREKYLRGEVNTPYIQQESTFWKRSLWQKIGGGLDPAFDLAADLELWARFFRHASLHTLHAPLGGFRSHPGQGQRSEVSLPQYNREAESIIVRERAFFNASPDKTLLPAPAALYLKDVVPRAKSRISPEMFGFFTYSRSLHFPYFSGFDLELYDRGIDPNSCEVRVYQELLIYTFIRHNLPRGSKILALGEERPRILHAAHADYEIWRLRPGQAGGGDRPDLAPRGCRTVSAEIGSFSPELAEGYFDFVFGVFPVEDAPETAADRRNMLLDMARVVKPGGWSLSCFDVLAGEHGCKSSPLLPYLFQEAGTSNRFAPFEQVSLDPFAFFRSQPAREPDLEQLDSSQPGPARWLSYNALWANSATDAARACLDRTPLSFAAARRNLAGHALETPGSATLHRLAPVRSLAQIVLALDAPRKLRIGGEAQTPGWEIMNLVAGPHVGHVGDARDLSRFPDCSLNEIYASHTFECFSGQAELLSALKEWHRALKPFGTLYLSVPDMDAMARLLLDRDNLALDERLSVLRLMFGENPEQSGRHGVGLNEDLLCSLLHQAGFKLARRIDRFPLFQDESGVTFKNRPIILNMVARKLPSAK